MTWEAPEGATHYDVTYYNHDTGVNAPGSVEPRGHEPFDRLKTGSDDYPRQPAPER